MATQQEAAPTSTAVAKRSPLGNLAELLERKKDELGKAAARGLRPERLVKIAIQAASRNPDLLACSAESIYLALLHCAELGLEPGPLGEAYLVPFKNNKTGKMECQFIAGYRGLVKLARNTGQLSTVTANVVYRGDEFAYHVDEKGPHLRHVPGLAGEASDSDITHAYQVVVMRDGTSQVEVMTRAQIEKTRAVSKAKDSGPWKTWFSEQCRKTVCKRGMKWVPMSEELARAIELDNEVEGAELETFSPPKPTLRTVTATEVASTPAALPEPGETLEREREPGEDDEPVSVEAGAYPVSQEEAERAVYEGMGVEERVDLWTRRMESAGSLEALRAVGEQLRARHPDTKDPVRGALNEPYQRRQRELAKAAGKSA